MFFSLTRQAIARRLLEVAFVTAALLIGGCKSPPPPPPPPPVVTVDETLSGAINAVLLDMARQLGPLVETERSVVIDPLLDGRSGQQTRATELAVQLLNKALPSVLRRARLLPFDEKGANDSRWLINGTLTRRDEPGAFRISLALSDRSSGLVVARAVAPFTDAQLDVAPTRVYSESPSLVRDRTVDGYLITAETPAGKPADALYLEQIPTAALLAEAAAAYNNERWDDSLRLYTSAVQRPDGQQLRTFNGLYLANTQLGRTAAAEDAFGKIAALGLATNNLAVKLLFRPGSVDFVPERNLSGAYPMWLRQIARAAQGADLCLNVVGHTSKTGSEPLNERLSLARARAVVERMDKDAPGIARKSRTNGVGSRENLVGIGTDDLRDAPDRRVEFKVIACT